MLELYDRNLYKLDGKLCKGAFTGDAFCNASWDAIGVSRFSVSRYVQTPSFRGDCPPPMPYREFLAEDLASVGLYATAFVCVRSS